MLDHVGEIAGMEGVAIIHSLRVSLVFRASEAKKWKPLFLEALIYALPPSG
jgi:hypothetical protein